MSTQKTPQSTIRDAIRVAGTLERLARELAVSISAVHQWASGTRPIPPRRCVQLEVLYPGVVSRQALRPNDWHLIWPELASKVA